ncbi:MAG: YgiQ family radical SAM protein [Deltaproteobacteria bacterium]|nr:YgiQ family radical SAM protein [Deltaproteobacteria bacterium]
MGFNIIGQDVVDAPPPPTPTGDRRLVAPFLPASPEETRARGWDAVDVVFVTGDAYVDHPSFAMAVLGRVLEARGYRVGILAQPDWRAPDAFRAFGKPRLAFCVSAGNLDSMLNHYTAHKRPRRDDAYSPGARAGLRPDKPTLQYTQRCRQAWPEVPVIVGGMEASMRRLAHYDYWSDTVKRSIQLDAKADLLVYGAGERPLLEILARLRAGEDVRSIRDVRGTVYALGASEAAELLGARESAPSGVRELAAPLHGFAALELAPFDLIRADKPAFARVQHAFHREQNPHNARALVQRHGDQAVVQNPPQPALTTTEMDWLHGLPYNKLPHPCYGQQRIPAYEMVRFSIQVMRGCFGGCTFCAITEHQGKTIQSRSEASILREVEDLQRVPGYTGVVSDLGGPTANMFRLQCGAPETEKVCRRHSCVHPTICTKLVVDQGPVTDLMRRARHAPGVKKVLIGSGVRMDLADDAYIRELAAHHVGGHLKVAPEHVDEETLARMKKPGVDVFVQFKQKFDAASRAAGKEQYLVPYFVSSHPGCDMDGAIALANFLKEGNFRPEQVQDFIPTPMTPATCMWFTGIDPLTLRAVYVERDGQKKKQQKALMQYWRPENHGLVKDALRGAGRADLLGTHRTALVEEYQRMGWQPPRDKGKFHGRPKRKTHPGARG